MLTKNLRRELLVIARSSIASALQQKPARTAIPSIISDELMQPGGAFVTLHTNKELRGCIGYIESILPLAEVVGEVAVKAAIEDPRFPPLGIHELGQTTIEISVLSRLRRIASKDEIRIGEHGLLLEYGPYKGVLLPQVAVEYGWSVEEFLDAVSRKAGAHRSAWRSSEVQIQVFTAEVIAEEEILHEHLP